MVLLRDQEFFYQKKPTLYIEIKLSFLTILHIKDQFKKILTRIFSLVFNGPFPRKTTSLLITFFKFGLLHNINTGTGV